MCVQIAALRYGGKCSSIRRFCVIDLINAVDFVEFLGGCLTWSDSG